MGRLTRVIEVRDKPEIGDEVVIVGNKPIDVYKASLSKAKKNNGKVVLEARGNNIQKALSLSVWANKALGVIIERTDLSHVDFNGGELITHIKIVMKENKLFFSMIPVFIFFRLLLGSPLDPLIGVYTVSGLLDILGVGK